MRAQLIAAIRAVLVTTVVCGIAYPVATTIIANIGFRAEATGSLVRRDGRVVGSRLIGQRFEGRKWFHPRPSAAGDGYDSLASSPSNLGPSNPVLLREIATRARAYRKLNGLAATTRVPIDAVTASGSGLDPDISLDNARLQARRVATARNLPLATVLRTVDNHLQRPTLGFIGEPRVNVLELNLALDDLAQRED